MTFYIINKNKNFLASSTWRSQFCEGLRGFSKNAALTFKTEEEAKAYTERMLFCLEEWISSEIPNQSKNWSKFSVDGFLERSQKQYLKNKKNILSLQITDTF